MKHHITQETQSDRASSAWLLHIAILLHYPFHLAYRRALTSGKTSALKKLVGRALREKSQARYFVGDDLTTFEELITTANTGVCYWQPGFPWISCCPT
jgi:hypothetical protein